MFLSLLKIIKLMIFCFIWPYHVTLCQSSDEVHEERKAQFYVQGIYYPNLPQCWSIENFWGLCKPKYQSTKLSQKCPTISSYLNKNYQGICRNLWKNPHGVTSENIYSVARLGVIKISMGKILKVSKFELS